MQKLQLSIPEPCHESWQQMTPTQQGRFCNACAKEVVDFSMMNDAEVLNYFTTLTHQKVCGRALPSQLNRDITLPKEPKKRLFWYWNYIVMFFIFFSKTNGAKAQGDLKPVTELSPTKPADNFKEEVAIASWVVTGKVSDMEGRPVPFATIKIKGTQTGLSADANGKYSIRVKLGAVFIISGASFKDAEVKVGTQRNLIAILEKGGTDLREVVVSIAGWVRRRDFDKRVIPADTKYTVTLQVKDDKSSLPINKAKIIIAKNNTNSHDTAFADKLGSYTWKDIKKNENYFIKVEVEGYETNEFTITAKELNDKKIWEVLLKKTESVKPNENSIRLRGISIGSISKAPLYVVDGTIVPNGNEINPEDIEDISVLQGPAASALFGPDASNGAIVITTRKAKIKNLDTVAVQSAYLNKKLLCRAGGMRVRYKTSVYSETKARINTLLTDSLKVYPNPVQRGNSFGIALKLKQMGSHHIQVADAAGVIVLQKQVNVPAREYKETIPTNAGWSAGVYYIRVFDNKNKLVSKSSFIVR